MNVRDKVILITLLAILATACAPATSNAPTATARRVDPPPPPPTLQAPRATTTQPSPGAAELTITIGAPISGASIKPLLGVNVGPIAAGKDGSGNPDVTAAYQQIGVNLIRTHDFYGPLDMSVLYPDRTRDPAQQSSYNFATSDPVWRAIVNGGFEPYFRLGDSYNNATPPANAQERANWARAAVEIIRHYREGKWNGFSTKFRYVEIWNEPDNQQFWQKPHTPGEYNQLYAETALALKRAFPDLLVGGPGLTPGGALAPQGQRFTQEFLDNVQQNKTPLDFFSWHMYSNKPEDFTTAADFYRAQLDQRGLTKTLMHVTEWNTQVRDERTPSADGLALRTGGKGAAILTAAWIGLQQKNIEVATFYRGTEPARDMPTWYGLFYADGKPKRIAHAFALWSKTAAHATRVETRASATTSLWMLAGRDSAGEIALLLANPSDKPTTWAINFADNRKSGDFKISVSQVSDASEQIQTSAPNNGVVTLGANAVQLVVLTPR